MVPLFGRIQPASSTARNVIVETQRGILERAGMNTSVAAWERTKWASYSDLAKNLDADLEDRYAYEYTGVLLWEVGPYQNANHLFLLTKHTVRLLDTARRMGSDWVVTPDLVLASTLSAHFNARTMVLPRERGNLLLFSDGVMVLLWLMGSIFSQMYSSVQRHAASIGRTEMSPDDFRSVLPRDVEPIVTASHAIWSYVITGGVRRVVERLPPDALIPASGVPSGLFAEGMLQLVIAHELGHLREGHLDQRAREAFLATPEGRELSFDWVQEQSADRYGATVATQSLFRGGVQPWVAGLVVELAFVVQGLVEHATDLLMDSTTALPPVKRAHPPAWSRLQIAQDGLDHLARINPVVEGVVHAHEVADVFLRVLLIHIEQLGRTMIEKGIPPHPSLTEGRAHAT